MVPNTHVEKVIIKAVEEESDGSNQSFEAHLDSHANMFVLGKFCRIVGASKQTIRVSGWSSVCGIVEDIPIVDAIIGFNCPITNMNYFMLV